MTLLKWLDELPNEYTMSKPNLGLCHARVLFQSGHQEVAEKLIDHLERTHVFISAGNPSITNGQNETPEASAAIAFQGRIAADMFESVNQKILIHPYCDIGPF